MKKIAIIFFMFFPSLSFAGVKYDVSCPANKDVLVSFQWKSTVNISVASNTSSVVLPETPSGIFSSFTIPAYSSASGVVPVVFSSGTIQSFSCAEKLTDVTFQLQMSELYLKMYMFAFGVILALAFISGMKGSV